MHSAIDLSRPDIDTDERALTERTRFLHDLTKQSWDVFLATSSSETRQVLTKAGSKWTLVDLCKLDRTDEPDDLIHRYCEWAWRVSMSREPPNNPSGLRSDDVKRKRRRTAV